MALVPFSAFRLPLMLQTQYWVSVTYAVGFNFGGINCPGLVYETVAKWGINTRLTANFLHQVEFKNSPTVYVTDTP